MNLNDANEAYFTSGNTRIYVNYKKDNIMKTAEEVRKLMPVITETVKVNAIMYQIEEAAKAGHYFCLTRDYHDNNEIRQLMEVFKKLDFKVKQYGFQLHISWDK